MERKAVVIYDRDCGLCVATRRVLEPLDLLGALEWLPFQDPRAAGFGIPRRDLEEYVHLVAGPRAWRGFGAMKQILLRLPPLYAAAAFVALRFPKAILPAIAVFYSPLFQPAGDRLYALVSHNRHRWPRSHCARA